MYALNMIVRAHVKNGRLIVDEPTDLPDGTELELAPLDEDRLDDEEREKLHAAMDRAHDDLAAGRFVDGKDVIARLRREPP